MSPARVLAAFLCVLIPGDGSLPRSFFWPIRVHALPTFQKKAVKFQELSGTVPIATKYFEPLGMQN